MNFIDAAGVLADSAQLLIDDKKAHEARAVVQELVAAYDALAPDWSQAPEWGKWYAIDADGHAYWYEAKPYRTHVHQWTSTSFLEAAGFAELILGIDWRWCKWERAEVEA